VLLEACGADLSWMILAVSGLAFIVVAWLGRQKGESLVDESAPAGDRSETAQLILAVGIGAAIAVLGARLTWLHYYFLMLPLLVYVLRPLPQQMRPVAALVHRLSGVIVLLAMSNLVVVAVYSTTAHAWVLSAGATMLLALGLWDLLPTASPTLPGSRPGL
jgi:hypothetical protein